MPDNLLSCTPTMIPLASLRTSWLKFKVVAHNLSVMADWAPTSSHGVRGTEKRLKHAKEESHVIQLYNQRRYSEAMPLAQRALAIQEKALGKTRRVRSRLPTIARLMLAKMRPQLQQLAIGAAWPHHGFLRWPKGPTRPGNEKSTVVKALL